MILVYTDPLVDRWLTDSSFRADLRADLRGTLRRAGFSLTAEETAALLRIPWELSDAELIAKARSSNSIDKIW